MRYIDRVSNNKKSISSFFIGSISGLAVFIVILISIFLKFQVDSKEKYIEALRELSDLKFSMENIFTERLALAKGVVALVKVNPDISNEEFSVFSTSLLGDDDLIRNITLLKGTIISYVHPYEENKSALGVDLARVEGQKNQIIRVRETKEPLITGVINLVQGGRGIIFRMPIFTGEAYWGQVSTVINADRLFDLLEINDLTKKYDISIKRVRDSNFSDEVIYGEEEVFFYREIELEVRFANARWLIGAIPKNTNYMQIQKVWGAIIFSLLASILIGYIIGYTYHIKNLMKKLAFTDSLTGLQSRLSLSDNFDRIAQMVDKLNCSSGVLVVDINDFKYINDTYGHIIGDEVLIQFAKRVSGTLNSEDIMLRIGGDEFLILLANIKSDRALDAIKDEVNRIQMLLERDWTINEKSIKVKASIGYALYPNDAKDIDELIHIADIMMYEEKRKTRGE